MLILGPLMGIEKNASWDRRFAPPQAAVLITVGAASVLYQLACHRPAPHRFHGGAEDRHDNEARDPLSPGSSTAHGTRSTGLDPAPAA